MYYLICLSKRFQTWNIYQNFNLSFNIDLANDAINLSSIKKSRKLCRQALHRQVAFIKNISGQRYRRLAVAGDNKGYDFFNPTEVIRDSRKKMHHSWWRLVIN